MVAYIIGQPSPNNTIPSVVRLAENGPGVSMI
jgi:hypothetical protein